MRDPTSTVNIQFPQLKEVVELLSQLSGKNVETLEECLKTVKAMTSEIIKLKQRVDVLEKEKNMMRLL